jgi:hypothetical protein
MNYIKGKNQERSPYYSFLIPRVKIAGLIAWKK